VAATSVDEAGNVEDMHALGESRGNFDHTSQSNQSLDKFLNGKSPTTQHGSVQRGSVQRGSVQHGSVHQHGSVQHGTVEAVNSTSNGVMDGELGIPPRGPWDQPTGIALHRTSTSTSSSQHGVQGRSSLLPPPAVIGVQQSLNPAYSTPQCYVLVPVPGVGITTPHIGHQSPIGNPLQRNSTTSQNSQQAVAQCSPVSQSRTDTFSGMMRTDRNVPEPGTGKLGYQSTTSSSSGWLMAVGMGERIPQSNVPAPPAGLT